MLKKLTAVLLAATVVGLLCVVGCKGQQSPSAPQSATPQEKQGEISKIDVGVIVSLTGMNAMTGADQRWAYEQAVADINAAGGVMVAELGKKLPIELILADDKSTAADAAAAAEKLIKAHGVRFILGTNITPLNIAAATVAEKYKVYYAACVTWLDQFGEQNFQWATDLSFSARNVAEVPFLIWNSQPEAERPRRIGLLMEDNPDGQWFASAFREFATKYGYQIAVDEAYTPGAKDFSSSIMKMKGNNVDALLWLGSPTDSITLVRQMKDLKFAPKYIHGWKGFWPNEFVEAIGSDADYIVHDGFWAESLPYPGAAELGRKYREAHDGKDSVNIGPPYANVQVLAKAIERAGSLDPAKVRDEVFGGRFEGTVMGNVQFDEKGLGLTPSFALQWYQGKRMPVYPDLGTWKLKWFPGWETR